MFGSYFVKLFLRTVLKTQNIIWCSLKTENCSYSMNLVFSYQIWRLQLSKIDAPIIKDGGFKYGGFKLSIIWPLTLHFFFLVR